MAMATSDEMVKELARLSESSAAVIVEGKNDRAALQRAGVRNEIFVLSEKPLFAVAEDVAAAAKTAIILTDLDAEGKKMYGKLNTALQRLGARIDNRFRDFLYEKTQLRQIEGLKVEYV